MTTAIFQSFDPARVTWQGSFEHPLAIHTAIAIDDVVPLVELVDRETRDGRWAALLLAYESGPAFDPAIKAHTLDGFPLAWAAIFDSPVTRSHVEENRPSTTSDWSPLVPRDSYLDAITAIKERIRAGDTYQVNYTFPLTTTFSGDPLAWYQALGVALGAGYCAYLDMGRYQVLSLSPELFFERKVDLLTARPMKGTMPRGRWTEEDEARSADLAADEKNRAENVMIVDLLRSDLGRVSIPGSVQVTRLFEVERYQTVLQMTSTIQSRCRPDTSLVSLMRALFPCGSITGAPKIRTSEIIRDLEPFARGAYTGAIGLIKPGGDCIFNVAIRTVTLDTHTGHATFGTGGGITYDSVAEDEYEECRLKSSFLFRAAEPEFELVETILLEAGEFFLLDRHIQRLASSAGYFGFLYNAERVMASLDAIATERPNRLWKVRMLVDRDGGVQTSIDELSLEGLDPAAVQRVALAARPVDSGDPFLFHKTTNRRQYADLLREARDVDDLIFWNEQGQVTESSIANIVAVMNGEKVTPPKSCGLLPGTYRDQLLAQGELKERVIQKDDLARADALFLVNSVRKWVRVELSPEARVSLPG